MATGFGTWLNSMLTGKFVGKDEFGNRYFEARRANKHNARKRRWVLYNGVVEASKITAEWHGWMHHTTDERPNAEATRRFSWQKPHQPNLTGTKGRYLPKGHVLEGGARAKSSADYTPWNPDNA